MDKEYTVADMEGKTGDEVTAMLKHNKRLHGDYSDDKPEYIESELTLRDKYLEPPFSVLDTKTGSWQKRKRKWLEMGIQSEIGRNVDVLPGKSNNDYMPDMASSTSIFDPALCELMYTWFCPPVIEKYECENCDKIFKPDETK